MMDPFSRKLFTTRDAREHLRSMGGILSSSPRLAETVAKFQVGGNVIAPVVGGSQEPVRATYMGVDFAVFPGGRVVNTLSNQEVTEAQDPTGELRRVIQSLASGELEAVGVPPEMAATASPEELLNILDSEDVTEPMRERWADATTPYQAPEPLAPVTFLTETLPGAVAEQFERPAVETAVSEQKRAAETAEEERRAAARMEAEAEAQAEAQAAAEASDSDLASAERERQAAAQRAAEEMRRGGGENGEVIDFDTTFDQMLSRLERVMGTKDENSRQKAMANLAMIGLAIAAGQSPDALTNIAQGALTGMQAIRKEEAAEEAAQREMRLTALQMASAEVDSRRKLANALQIAGLRSGGRDPYTRERMRQQLVVAITNRINDFPQVQNPDGSINPQSLNATVESLLEAGVLPEDLSESDKALIGAGG